MDHLLPVARATVRLRHAGTHGGPPGQRLVSGLTCSQRQRIASPPEGGEPAGNDPAVIVNETTSTLRCSYRAHLEHETSSQISTTGHGPV